MLLSWNWLKQYVPLTMSPRELETRLMMAGLNHEETHEVGDDLAIDLEVTSNRPDCLGHIGIAREVSVLWDCALTIPPARPAEGKTRVEDLVRVRIECPDLCTRYTARVVRGVRIGPSPDWLTKRLATIGIASINNVVDVSNYVMMECGQPLHTFDYAKLAGPEIVVRRPRADETIEAIDHKTYRLDGEMCAIADARLPVAIGGVMGGAATEVNERTRDVLIEAADFDPISIRTTARQLSLHSASSYRFERRVDPEGLDWASRRCAELILELAGGELAAGVVDVGAPREPRAPIVLRLAQLKRILGIEVEPAVVRRILAALGNVEAPVGNGLRAVPSSQGAGSGERGDGTARSPFPTGSLLYLPPSWRRDLTREIDLIEEVARIHGYEQIPEDVSVPMAASSRRREDRLVAKLRTVLTAAGFDEAMTLSAVDAASARTVQAWTQGEPLRSRTPVIRGADHLRTSLVPSLLGARRTNASLSNPVIELFEIAKIYLPGPGLPEEWWMLAVSSGRPYAEVKGVVEALLAATRGKFAGQFGGQMEDLAYEDAGLPLLDPNASCRLMLDGQLLGYAGQLSAAGQKQSDLRGPCTVAELKLAALFQCADLVPQYVPLPAFPAVSRDLNLVVDEAVRWAQIAATVRGNGGPDLESLEYRDTYRDADRLGAGKKSFLFSIGLRWQEGTLTSQQADGIRDRIVAACRRDHGAELRA
jgi:phenylalanyl-tRNA synthetase beta chain